jgi:hypothetical protein
LASSGFCLSSSIASTGRQDEEFNFAAIGFLLHLIQGVKSGSRPARCCTLTWILPRRLFPIGRSRRYSKCGQARTAKLNQGDSVNGPSQPAARGPVIQRQHHAQPTLEADLRKSHANRATYGERQPKHRVLLIRATRYRFKGGDQLLLLPTLQVLRFLVRMKANLRAHPVCSTLWASICSGPCATPRTTRLRLLPHRFLSRQFCD